MKYLGIDYGLKRIGLAISQGGGIASPIGCIQNKGDKKNVSAIRIIINRQFETSYCGSVSDTPLCIVLGLPLLKDGNPSSMVQEVQRFGELLGSEFAATVVYHNEYLSSVNAEQYIREKLGITDRTKVKELVDGVAAAMILQSYTDTHT